MAKKKKTPSRKARLSRYEDKKPPKQVVVPGVGTFVRKEKVKE